MKVNENIKNRKKTKTKMLTVEICNFMYAK